MPLTRQMRMSRVFAEATAVFTVTCPQHESDPMRGQLVARGLFWSVRRSQPLVVSPRVGKAAVHAL